MEKKYRENVGLMIVNDQGLVWIGERVNSEKFGYKYQMPQGGIDKGETILEAAYRELWEETGILPEKVEFLAESKEWYQYDFFEPLEYKDGLYHGQKQKWVLFRFKGIDADFNLTVHPEEIEFSSFFWSPVNDIVQMVVPFKRDVYSAVIEEFLPLFKVGF